MGKNTDDQVFYVLPFDHYAPAGGGTEEHGPPTISLVKLVIFATLKVCNIPAPVGVGGLHARPGNYTALKPISAESIIKDLSKAIDKRMAILSKKHKTCPELADNVLLYILHLTTEVIPSLTNVYSINRNIYRNTIVGKNNIVDYDKLAADYR